MAAAAAISVCSREVAFDVLKGIGICEVLLHHCLAHSARKFTEAGSSSWWAMMVTNRVLHFAIPVFLFASALLLARSLTKRDRPNWTRFYARRGARTLWPYLVWSAAYILFRLAFVRMGSDVEMVAASTPWGQITGPALLLDGSGLLHDLAWGDAYYHLYFLGVLLQMAIVFPIILFIARRWRWGFGWLLAAAMAAQLAVFLGQGRLFTVPYPGSTVLWYLPAVVVGAWLGANWRSWEEIWQRSRAWLAAGAGLGFVLYLACAIALLQGKPIFSLAYSIGFSVYTTCFALVLLAMAQRIGTLQWSVGIRWLGNGSLAVFLVHPMFMYLLSGPKIGAAIASMPLAPMWFTLAIGSLSAGFLVLATWMRLDLALFGRRFVERAPRAVEAPVFVPADGFAPAGLPVA